MEILEIGLLCIVSFTIGAKVGQRVSKGETVLPIKTPTRIVEEIKENREFKKEQERNKIISENIDNYNGTNIGQQDLPR